MKKLNTITIRRIKEIIRNMKKMASIISFFLGFLLSYAMYAGGNMKKYSLILPLLFIGICSVIISVLLNRKIKDRFYYFFYSLLSSYFMSFSLIVILSIIIDDNIFIVFSPIIFMFLLPMIFMSVFSVYLFFKEDTGGN